MNFQEKRCGALALILYTTFFSFQAEELPVGRKWTVTGAVDAIRNKVAEDRVWSNLSRQDRSEERRSVLDLRGLALDSVPKNLQASPDPALTW